MACGADHEGLPPLLRHKFHPWRSWHAGRIEFGELADMVDLHVTALLAVLALPSCESRDQLFTRESYPAQNAVLNDRVLLPS
jgi:hypothetical protein